MLLVGYLDAANISVVAIYFLLKLVTGVGYGQGRTSGGNNRNLGEDGLGNLLIKEACLDDTHRREVLFIKEVVGRWHARLQAQDFPLARDRCLWFLRQR